MAKRILECHDCGARYDVSKRKAGSKVKCKRCHTRLKIPKKPKLSKAAERAQSLRIERSEAVSQRQAVPDTDDIEFKDGELVHALRVPFRSKPVEASAITASFLTMIKRCAGRLVTLTSFAIVAGFVGSIIAVIIASILTSDPSRGRLYIEGFTSLITAVIATVMLTSGMIIGAKVLRDTDVSIKQALSEWNSRLGDIWRAIKSSLACVHRILALELFLYTSILIGLIIIVLLSQLPSAIVWVLALAIIPIFVLGPTLMFTIVQMAMVGVAVEQRPVIFSLKRSWILVRSALKPTIISLFVFALISGLIGLGAQFIALIVSAQLVGKAAPVLAGVWAVLFGRCVMGVYVTALHYELTREEGQGEE